MTNNLKILCAMGKKKKTYVRPEMKIIEVKTEGVIAASGGEVIIDKSQFCANGCLDNSNSCGLNNKPNCQNIDVDNDHDGQYDIFSATFHCGAYQEKPIHFQYINDGQGKIKYWPCDCNK